MANWSGVAATLGALVRPRVLEPALRVPSIASLDFARLANEGNVVGVIIDKDNCIAPPRSDSLAPDPALHAAWASLLRTFGPHNVLVVSNSAGSLSKDPLLLQAEALSRNLAVPVLVHEGPKPAHKCVEQVVYSPLARARASHLAAAAAGASTSTITATKAGPPTPTRLLVIGDRLATDMILAHRLSALSFPLSAVPVLTTHLWAREGWGTTLLRWVERGALWGLDGR
ncbi:mitochondrial PGP phosphatase-domain-containing protein, partial [Rhodotorula diobovata]